MGSLIKVLLVLLIVSARQAAANIYLRLAKALRLPNIVLLQSPVLPMSPVHRGNAVSLMTLPVIIRNVLDYRLSATQATESEMSFNLAHPTASVRLGAVNLI